MRQTGKKRAIIFSYPCMIALKFLYSTFARGFHDSILYLLMLIAYAVFAFLVLRGSKVAEWIIIMSMLLSGIGTFLVGVFFIPINQVAIKAVSVLLGLYFVCGGMVLLSLRRSA